MKIFLVVVTILIVNVIGCQNETKNKSFVNDNNKTSKTTQIDSSKFLTIIKYDSIKFRNFLTKIIPPKKVFNLFGGGYHNFYLNIKEIDNNKVYYRLMPEAASLFTGVGINEKFEWKSKDNLFYVYNELPNYIKTRFPQQGFAMYNDFLQIDITLTNSGEIVNHWNFTKIDLNKFKPVIQKNINADQYLGFLPAILKSDYKALQKLIVLPQTAINRRVSGKIFVKVFFNEDGSYAGYQLIKGLGYGSDESVIKAIKDYPPSSYSSGEKTSSVIPFKFGESNETEIDLTSSTIEEKFPEKYNNLVVKFYNKLSKVNSIKQSYLYNIRINNENVCGGLLNVGDNTLFFRWKPKQSGTFNYEIFLDPENILNDVDRSNNIVRGKLVIK